jgi:hypothetical protein
MRFLVAFHGSSRQMPEYHIDPLDDSSFQTIICQSSHYSTLQSPREEETSKETLPVESVARALLYTTNRDCANLDMKSIVVR